MSGRRAIWGCDMSEPARTSLRDRFDQQHNAAVEAKLEDLLQRITSAAHTMNVCALNLQSAEAVFQRSRLWLAVGVCVGLALAALIGPYWPW